MNKSLIYPAVFYPDGGYISVYFPDLEGCLTFGSDFNDAYAMVKDALGSVHLEDNHVPDTPSIEDIKLKPDEKAMLIEVDAVYLKEVCNKICTAQYPNG
ncbi:MAG: type II toxin-antitoxin system HicB family antitoxin [Syntrophobacterales bacterium]|jgi:predicted RNase H-like HicB family nuclease|nr:type II toxin-antitoxin system HicB family antitoxin [Syntrophobacterales bacterium]